MKLSCKIGLHCWHFIKMVYIKIKTRKTVHGRFVMVEPVPISSKRIKYKCCHCGKIRYDDPYSGTDD